MLARIDKSKRGPYPKLRRQSNVISGNVESERLPLQLSLDWCLCSELWIPNDSKLIHKIQ